MGLSGAQLIARTLARLGVEAAFGLPGSFILPLYDALAAEGLRLTGARHEQGAALMAEGYAMARGGPALCRATAGPGATNLVTGLAAALADSQPVLVITGQVPRGFLGRGALQEAAGHGRSVDQLALLAHVCKGSRRVGRAADLEAALLWAWSEAVSGRPGPVNLGVSPEGLAALALRAENPLRLGSRCSVFMESDLIHHQQRGTPLSELAAGLCYGAAANYLERVANGRELTGPVAFLGGLAANRGVVAALGALTGQALAAAPGHLVSGAIGAAHLLREAAGQGGCLSQGRAGPEAFARREALLLREGGQAGADGETALSGEAVGLPRALLWHRHYPFWRTLLTYLRVPPVVSGPAEAEGPAAFGRLPIECCRPLRLALAHGAALRRQGVARLLAPAQKEEATGGARAWCCPYVQTLPYLLRHALGGPVLAPMMPRLWTPRALVRALRPLAAEVGASGGRLRRAVEAGLTAQREFEAARSALGRQAAEEATPERSALLLGRDYVLGEAALGREVLGLLAACGVAPLPGEALSAPGLPEPDVFWREGLDYLTAARVAARRGLAVLMVTCFGCGPDSFLEKHLRRLLGERLWVLELDGHASRAGLETRIEAFCDLVRAGRKRPAVPAPPVRAPRPRPKQLEGRTIYVPYAGEPFRALVAALRSVGLAAELLPAPDEVSEALGRRHTSGRECLPYLYHAGDVLRLAARPGFEAWRAALFVPGNDESCRVSQYAPALRLLLDGLGLGEVALFAPRVSMESDEALDWLGLRFGRRLWRGWVGLEALRRELFRVRPYEALPGAAEAAYRQARGLIRGALSGPLFWAALRRALDLVRGVPRRPGPRRPRVAILGDYYLRGCQFASRDLALRLEALGAEVVPGPFFTDYLRFQAHRRPRHLWGAREPLRLAQALVRAWGLKRDYARLATLAHLHEPGPEECVRAARGYLGCEVDPPPLAALGELAHYQGCGVAGVVNPIPLHCLYGNIATSPSWPGCASERCPSSP